MKYIDLIFLSIAFLDLFGLMPVIRVKLSELAGFMIFFYLTKRNPFRGLTLLIFSGLIIYAIIYSFTAGTPLFIKERTMSAVLIIIFLPTIAGLFSYLLAFVFLLLSTPPRGLIGTLSVLVAASDYYFQYL